MAFVDRPLPVIEIFGPTIQGEGPLIGQLTHFIRLGGCGYRCTWCDSMHAVDPVQIKEHARYMHAVAIVAEVQKLGSAQTSARYVTISGGDPAMWDLYFLIRELQSRGYKISIETQGQFWKSWMPECDSIVVSPKPPSSGMSHKIEMADLATYVQMLHRSQVPRMAFKVVVFDEKDFDWAVRLHKHFVGVPFFLSVGTKRPTDTELEDQHFDPAHQVLMDYDELIRMAVEKKVTGDLRILPQTHVLLWGHKQGV